MRRTDRPRRAALGLGTSALLLAMASVPAGCSLLTSLLESPPPATTVPSDGPHGPLPFARSFGPTYAAQQPVGQPTRIDRATLSPDRQILTIDFVGGPAYLQSDPCSTDYEPWLAPRGDQLDVVVVQIRHPEQVQLPPNHGCALLGYGWTFHLALPVPFAGTTIKDLASGGTLLVGPPPGTAHLGMAPPGWVLLTSVQFEPGPPAMWTEIHGRPGLAPVLGDEGPGLLVLYQAFGIVGEWTETRAVKSEDRGGTPVDVILRGRPATVWVDPAIGELLLGWDAGGRSYGLVGNSADMTVEDLVRYAASVTIPS